MAVVIPSATATRISTNADIASLGTSSCPTACPSTTSSTSASHTGSPTSASGPRSTSRYDTEEPKTIAAALKHPHWNASVSDEMTNIHLLRTWTLVEPTAEMNILGCRWIFKIQFNPDGTRDVQSSCAHCYYKDGS